MNIDNTRDILYFPSGRSVKNCQKDAKRLKKSLGIPHHQALNEVARLNGLDMNWAEAMQHLDSQMGATPQYPIMTVKDIDHVIAQYPRLTHFGFGVFDEAGMSYADLQEKMDRNKEELRNAVDECNRACRFIAHLDKRQTFNNFSTSYGLKHQVEHFLSYQDDIDNTYIANGSFICAAIHMGFKVKESYLSPNAIFNISSKSPVLLWRKLSEKSSWDLSEKQKAVLQALEQQLNISRSNYR